MGQQSSRGSQLRAPTMVAERQGQGCHHPVTHPGPPDGGRELGSNVPRAHPFSWPDSARFSR